MTKRQAEVIEALRETRFNVSKVAKKFGIARQTVQSYMKRAGVSRDKEIFTGSTHAVEVEKLPLPKRGVKRYLFSSAQNNTDIVQPVWKNLLAVAKHYDIPKSRIYIASYAYNQNAYGSMSVKRGTEKFEDQLWFAPEIESYLRGSDKDICIAPGLVWCGRTNISPTAKDPLSGFETYTGRSSGIFPHPKIALSSVPSMKHEGTKVNYTTGTLTKRNYIQKGAGIKAEKWHTYGALLVEVLPDGSWYARQLMADHQHDIYDLGLKFSKGRVSKTRVEAINWGDIHEQEMDPVLRQLYWGPGGVYESLRPRYQFLHDSLSFRSRNHHDRKDPHTNFKKFVLNADDVEAEVHSLAKFLKWIDRPWCRSVVVDSNHDRALERWLREADYREDPKNAVFFLDAQSAKYKSIQSKDENFHLLEHVLRWYPETPPSVLFLREDQSFVICPDHEGGIEAGMHGHLGLKGRPGTPQQFRKMGRRTNTGHTHTALIIDGVWVAGTSSTDLPYEKGPTNKSQSLIVTYPTGTRAILTVWNGRAYA